jgi:hypothetical protein
MKVTAIHLPHAHFYQHANWLLYHGRKGDDVMLMASMVFSAIALEGYLNFLGVKILQDTWTDIQTNLSHDKKIALLANLLNHEIDKGAEPLQTIHNMFKFRNAIAHPKFEPRKEIDSFDPNKHPDVTGFKSLREWDNISVENATNYLKQLEQFGIEFQSAARSRFPDDIDLKSQNPFKVIPSFFDVPSDLWDGTNVDDSK